MSVGSRGVRFDDRSKSGLSGYPELRRNVITDGPTVETGPDDEHTDDELSDGREVDISQPVRTADGQFVGFAWTADPTVEDTDADTLDDDTEIPWLGSFVGEHAYDVYSGNMDHSEWAGGIDPTPENVSLPNDEAPPSYPWWSIMKYGTAYDSRRLGHPSNIPVLHFSVEELTTVDLP